MELEAILHFKGKYVKLTYHNGFNLHGFIKEVYKESILFQTKQKESVINIKDIRELVGGF